MRIRARLLHGQLPNDTSVLEARVDEGLSMLTRIEVVFACDEPAIAMAEMIWTDLVLELYDDEQPSVAPRAFHGMITEAAYLYSRDTHHVYRLVSEPAIATLRYRLRSRIFQEKSPIDVAKLVLKDAGLPEGDFDWAALEGTYLPRPYLTQYRESELDFVLRLLEEQGIFFWFEHDAAGHVMRMGDEPEVHELIEGGSALPLDLLGNSTGDRVYEVVFTSSATHDTHLARDWDFMQAQAPVERVASSEASIYTHYEYPAFVNPEEGQTLVGRRLEGWLQDRYRLSGRSNCLRLAPGRKVELLDLQPDFLVGEYLLVKLTHRFSRVAADDGAPRYGYDCSFVAQPAAAAFRPERAHRRPKVRGVESAVVTGASGAEIHTEELGRVKVHFYWDREGAIDQTASCWIRVQQNNTSGGLMMPRVGWEVSVAFENGDPDRPLVLQKLYNQETMPPYALPDNQTQSSLQSSTSPGGGSVNELRMQDASGGQQFGMYASRDLNVVTGHDRTERITVDATEAIDVGSELKVGADHTIGIGGNQSLSVTGTSTREVTGAVSMKVGANETFNVSKLCSLTAAADVTHDVGAIQNLLCNHLTETVNGNLARTVDAAQTIAAAMGFAETVAGMKDETVIGAKMEIVRKSKTENIGAAKALTSGAVMIDVGGDLSVSAGAAMAVTSAGSIEEKVGEGYTVTGSQVRVTAAGGAHFKGGSGELKLDGGTFSIDASKFGTSGGPSLQLKGRINFK